MLRSAPKIGLAVLVGLCGFGRAAESRGNLAAMAYHAHDIALGLRESAPVTTNSRAAIERSQASAPDSNWTELAPPHRFDAFAVYDPAGRRLLLFGGDTGAGVTGRVWIYSLDGQAWQSGPALPSQLGSGTPAFYDSARARVVVLQPGSPIVASAFSLTDLSWTTIASVTPPAGTLDSKWIYDPVRDRILGFGGFITYSVFHPVLQDTVWSLPLSGSQNWTPIMTTGPAPEPRFSCNAVYDAVGDRVIMFGGVDQYFQMLTDAWALSLSDPPSWQSLSPTGPVSGQVVSSGTLFDRADNSLIVYLNRYNVWSLSLGPTPTWTNLVGGGVPPADETAAAEALDEDSGRLFFYAPLVGELRVLALHPSPTWSLLNGSMAGRMAPSAIYDSANDRMVVFGGWTGSGPDVNETRARAFGGDDTWATLSPAGPLPPPRDSHTAVYDPVQHRMVLFGGEGVAPQYLNDTWSLALDANPTWSQLLPSGDLPAGRWAQAAIYDPARSRLIVFGGVGDSSGTGVPLNDVWALSLSGPATWTRLDPSGPLPSVRAFTSGIYDPVRDRFIVCGGQTRKAFVADTSDGLTWALNFSPSLSWQRLQTTGSPVTLDLHAAVYDPGADRMIVFGGLNNGRVSSETWALSFSSPVPAWSRIASGGDQPTARVFMSSAYDSRRGRMVLYAGSSVNSPYSFDGQLSDTWELSLAPDIATPALLSLAAVDAGPDLVTLRWSGANASYVDPLLQRRTIDSDWVTLGPALSDGAGDLSFDDRAVAPGRRYDYRLQYFAVGTTMFTQETWVETPERLALSLEGLRPNPAVGAVTVAFTLPRSAPASIGLFDAMGRRVLSKDLGGLGPGPHVLSLGRTDRIRAGVYWVELEQGGEKRIKRSVVLR